MARRSSFLEDLTQLPWQVSVILAFACYPAALIFVGFAGDNLMLKGFSSAVLTLWPMGSFAFLFTAALSFFNRRQKTKLFKRNSSLSKIQTLTWRQFEFYAGEAFRQKGYSVIETPEGPDGGVDLVLRKDGERTYVQCKHWKSHKVGVEKVRELLGVMAGGGADHGVFVTSGNFTTSAIRFGKQHGIKLINGRDLEYLIRVSPEENNLRPDIAEDAPECPYCNSLMIKRTARKGKNVGQQFWGCSRFPTCRGTLKA